MRGSLIVLVLLSAVISSALQIVVHRHESRKLFGQSQELRREIVELGREWGQLLLEQGTWGTQGRVEQLAREKLEMTIPTNDQIFRLGI